VGGFKPTTAQVAASRGRAHEIRADPLRLGTERASVRQGVRPHRRVGRRAKEKPYGVLGEAAGVRRFAPKARRPEKVSLAVRCGDSWLVRDIASKRRPRGGDRFKERRRLGSAGRPYGEAAARLGAGGADADALLTKRVRGNVCTARSRKGSSLGKKEGGAAEGSRRRRGGLRVCACALPGGQR
jgi:hypothetical protein